MRYVSLFLLLVGASLMMMWRDLSIASPQVEAFRGGNATDCDFVRLKTRKAAAPACARDLRGVAKLQRQWALSKPVLATSLGGAGTWRAAIALREAGLHVEHEAVGLDGSVSWLYAVRARYYPGKAAVDSRTRFRKVLHVVRCPAQNVGALSTHKRQTLEFAAKALGMDAPPDEAETSSRYELSARRLGNAAWLRFLAEVWLRWNERIERFSDGLARLEDEDEGSALCARVGLPVRGNRCVSSAGTVARVASAVSFAARDASNRLFKNGDYNPARCLRGTCGNNSNLYYHHRDHATVSWSALRDAAGPSLAARIVRAAHRYGYRLEDGGCPPR